MLSVFNVDDYSCFVILMAATLSLAACSPLQLLNRNVPRTGYRLTRDIADAPLPGQRLDIYVPTNLRLPAQVVVFFYSGRCSSGPRRSIGSLVGH